MTKFLRILLFLLLPPGVVPAQERLTLQDAITRALQHNFDIRMLDINEQQAARNNTLGNAGFSPYVIASASMTKSLNNVKSDLSNGTEQNNPHAASTNYNPYLQVNWTIFDGGKMFLVKKQLSTLESLAQAQLRAQVQTMVSRVIQQYAQVVLQQKQLIAIDTSLALAKVRIYISQLKYETGAGAKIDYLQAMVDYGARQSDSLTFLANISSAMDSLAVLMGENDHSQYMVDDSLELNTALQPMDASRLAEVNQNLAAYKYNADVSHLNADIARSYFLPTVAFGGVYAYSRTNNATGFTLFSRSYGPSGSLTATVPVFEGGNLRRQAKVASLQAMRDDLMYDRQNTLLGRQYRTAWKNYEISVAAYLLEHKNVRFAKENLDVQLARFKVGVGTTLESRQAENDYVTALERLYTAACNLKVNETIVLELENQLVGSR